MSPAAASVEIRARAGRLAQAQGRWAEQCAYCASLAFRAPWVRRVRYGTPAEDMRGIDLVVETDRGPLWVQVKSSERAARAFRRMYRSKRAIGVVVASQHKPLVELKSEVAAVLLRLYSRAGIHGLPVMKGGL